jgi:hypothetical protein
MQAAHVVWGAAATHYRVHVFAANGTVLSDYVSSNNPQSSAIEDSLPVSSLGAVPLHTMRKYALRTAAELAEQYKVPAQMIEQNDEIVEE